MPAADDEKVLTELVGELADRFGSPLFAPHLTLMSDRPGDPSTMTALCREVASDFAPFAAQIAAVETGPAFFRSLYARFAAMGPIAKLRQRVEAALSFQPETPFMPHISLAYGLAEGDAKESVRRELAQGLVGRPVHFDRIGVVHSADTIPVAEWRVVATLPLVIRKGAARP
jgi:2'-5' RNA ligase